MEGGEVIMAKTYSRRELLKYIPPLAALVAGACSIGFNIDTQNRNGKTTEKPQPLPTAQERANISGESAGKRTEVTDEIKQPTAAPTAQELPTKPAILRPTPEGKTLLTCERVQGGGPMIETLYPLPKVEAADLEYPSKQGSKITPFMASVVKDPGSIVYHPRDKNRKELQANVTNGFAYWIDDDNQFVLPESGQIGMRPNDGYVVVTCGEGILKYGLNEYLFRQDDDHGRRGYIAVVKVDGRTNADFEFAKLRCLVGLENKVQLYPKGRTISEEHILQLAERMHVDAAIVTVCTIDPFRNQVIAATQTGKDGQWVLEDKYTNVH